jgi:hypothetical protein
MNTAKHRLQSALSLALVLTLSACASTKGSVQNPYQNTPLQAPVTVIHGWQEGYSLDTPDTEDDSMRESALKALAKIDINANVRQAMQQALEKQGITPTFIDAPTPYNARFDATAPAEIAQVPAGSVLVVGVQPELVCVTSALESLKGTTEPTLLHPCGVVELQYSVLHYRADGSKEPPMVWRDTFKRSMTPQSHCRDVKSCTTGAVDSLLTRLRNIGLF